MSIPSNSAPSRWQRLSSFEIPRSLRVLVPRRESGLVLLAGAIGALAGLVVAGMGWGVTELHWILFAVPPGEHLSALMSLDPYSAVTVPLLGGLTFGLALMALARWRPTRGGDPIEANALDGGRMSLVGSASVALQTVWSSGVGASVPPAPPGLAGARRMRSGGSDLRCLRSTARWRVLCVRAGHRRLFDSKPRS